MLGTLAGILSTCSFLPQVFKVLRTKDVSGLSIWMWLINIIGAFCWAAHGFVIGDPALLYTDCVVFLLDLIVLVCMFRYGKPFAKAPKALPAPRESGDPSQTAAFHTIAGTH